MAADPDRACPHANFTADVDVNRVGEDDPGSGGLPRWYDVAVRLSCADCGEAFRWVGVPAGLSPREPMCSADETELRAPARPASSDPDFGMGIPGFAISAQGPTP